MEAEENLNDGTKRCPFCAEIILEAARKCKHCGSMLPDEDIEVTEEYPAHVTQVSTGQTLNERYVLSRRIARGGMAEIFLARDLELDMDVALKIVPPALADDARLIAHLRDEAKIAIQLTHQNIVRVYSFDASGEVKFIVMEYVDGKNLYHMVNETPEKKFEPPKIVDWLGPTCDALDYAHSLGVIHRDIKPSNIMVNESGIVKVADFGIARRLQDSMQSVSQHTIRGTPSYMSPEQLRGEKLTVLSDIYSLTATVYMLLAGEPPFTSAVVAASPDRPAPGPIVGISPRMFRVISRCLEFDPRKRLYTAKEFYDAMLDALHKPISTRVATPPEPPKREKPAEAARRVDAEEVPIRVVAEELPEGLDALGVTLRDKAAKAREEGDMAKAARLYGELATMAPQNPEAWCGLGDSHLKAGEYDRAIDAYRNAIKAEYDNIYAHFQIGLAHEELGQFDNAIKTYREAVKIIEADPSLHLDVSVKKLKNQIQNAQWKIEQAKEEHRKHLREVRENQEQELERAAARRRRTLRVVIIIILVLLLIAIGLGAAEYLLNIFHGP